MTQNPIQETVQGAKTPPPRVRAIYRSFDTITPKPVSWIWQGRIAIGKYTTIAGEPGLGKSQITTYLAAKITTGGAWLENEGRAPLGSVVIISCEDDPADTIAPRLMAAGADLSKVAELQSIKDGDTNRSFNLAADLGPLEDVLDKLGDVRLVIIDPISAYLGGTDSHKNADVRALLGPLSDLAQRKAVAIMGITHFNKGTGNAMQKFTGSGAFVAAARAAYIVAKDGDDPDRRLFLPVKNNLGQDKTGFAYRIEGVEVEGGISTSRVVFEEGFVDADANAVLAAQDGGGDNGEGGALAEAIAFLQEELAAGEVPSKHVENAAREVGIAKRTLDRAKRKINVKSLKKGNKWFIYMEGCQGCQESPSENGGTLGTLDPQGMVEVLI